MAAPSEPTTSEQRSDNSLAPLPAVAETSASLEISAPMLDVHAPHAGIHTWSDFLVHIATIVIGLLIAVGLEQTVEYLHHRSQVAEIRESLSLERRFNINRFAVIGDEFHRFVPKLETNLAVFQYLRSHPNAPTADWPGKLDWLSMNLSFLDTAWVTAQQSTILQYMPRAEVKRVADLYKRLRDAGATIDDAQRALNQARKFAIQDPDPSHLSSAPLERQIDLTEDVLLQYALIARAQNNLAARFSDFRPSLGRDDAYGILHATTDPDDQKAISALYERIERMEPSD
jgi:primosomal protein N''